jgi:hypothetical protein
MKTDNQSDKLPKGLLELIQKEVPYTDYKDAVKSFFEDSYEAIKAILNSEKKEEKEEGGMGVEVTYREIFRRVGGNDFALNALGVNPWYLSEGGNPEEGRIVGLNSAGLLGMTVGEFDGRAKKYRFLDTP